MFTCTARQGDPVHVRYLRYIVSQCIALFAYINFIHQQANSTNLHYTSTASSTIVNIILQPCHLFIKY